LGLRLRSLAVPDLRVVGHGLHLYLELLEHVFSQSDGFVFFFGSLGGIDQLRDELLNIDNISGV
jgi:hypothetical protein